MKMSTNNPINRGTWALLLLGIAVAAMAGEVSRSQPQGNPKGTFADWNTRVNCDRQVVQP